MNYNRYTKHKFSSILNPRGECEVEAERNNPMGQTFIVAINNHPTTLPKTITISEFCCKDAEHFSRYMTAKNAILKVADRQLNKNKEISFTCTEIDALFEFIPQLAEFYKRMMM